MSDLDILHKLFRHNAAANRLVFSAAAMLSDGQLDLPMDLGMGSVRAICEHVTAGEVTWLARIEGNTEAGWPAQAIPDPVDQMLAMLEDVASRLSALLSSLGAGEPDRAQRYRDSKGSLFQASLREMLLQVCLHSAHHRAQIVNGIRRVGGSAPEVDYMMSVRRPA